MNGTWKLENGKWTGVRAIDARVHSPLPAFQLQFFDFRSLISFSAVAHPDPHDTPVVMCNDDERWSNRRNFDDNGLDRLEHYVATCVSRSNAHDAGERLSSEDRIATEVTIVRQYDSGPCMSSCENDGVVLTAKPGLDDRRYIETRISEPTHDLRWNVLVREYRELERPQAVSRFGQTISPRRFSAAKRSAAARESARS